MESSLASAVFGWFLKTLAATAVEFLGLGGIFILFGIGLFWLEKRTFAILVRAFGFRSVVYSTGWIGTTAHELGHAVMCLVFGHRITELNLFTPDFDTGVMGSVKHSYDPENLYQLFGRFFIGLAPMITGSALLVGMVYFFFPEYTTVVKGFAEVSSERGYAVSDFLGDLWLPVAETFKVIFHPHNFMTWSFWVFLYVAVSVSSHLAPSRVDMEGAWFGLGVILVPVLLLNGIAVALGWNFVEDLVGLYPYIGAVAGFFAVALGLSILNFGVSYAVAAAWYWYRHRILLSPL